MFGHNPEVSLWSFPILHNLEQIADLLEQQEMQVIDQGQLDMLILGNTEILTQINVTL